MIKKALTIVTTFAALVFGAAVAQDLNGAGATFPAPLYDAMIEAYNEEFGIEVNYQAIGSGGGRNALIDQTVDFAGSDAFLSDAVMADAPGDIVHVATASGAVVLAFNLEGFADVGTELVLDGPAVADIYLGNITNWNDPAIAELNPGVDLPNLPITVAHRSDGSGTTSIFVDYLAKVSDQWAEDVSTGPQTSVAWPTGIGGDGNPGVTSIVANTPGAIGYVGLEYAEANDISYTSMVNASGNVVAPTLEAVGAAADAELPADLRVVITDSSNPQAWPIAGFTWILLYQDQAYANRSREQAQMTIDFVRWMLTDGQRFNNDLNYGQVTGFGQDRGLEILDGITYDGESLDGGM